MPNLNRIIIYQDTDNGKLQVRIDFAGDLKTSDNWITFANPMKPLDRYDLLWYLENYLSQAYDPIIKNKAKEIEAQMQQWGTNVFNQFFEFENRKAYALYIQAKNKGLRNFHIEIHQNTSEVRSFPWELLYDPEDNFFLVHQCASFSRCQGGGGNILIDPNASRTKLNVLLVITRPYARLDVPFRTVARPIMEMLKKANFREIIHIEALRPPTFQAFVNALERQREDNKTPFFDLVHFDGHGDFGLEGLITPKGDIDISKVFASGAQGKLLFEKIEGGEVKPDPKSAKEIRDILADHRVPLVLLNACRSAKEMFTEAEIFGILEHLKKNTNQEMTPEQFEFIISEKQQEEITSITSTLLNGGAEAVVGMSHSIYAKAASIFMENFYSKILEGKNTGDAIKNGRLALKSNPNRPTLFGDMPLQDWMIPIYHKRRDLTLFTPTKIETTEDKLYGLEALPYEPRFGFLGRDYELWQLEHILLRDNDGAIISGFGGTGKTTLAIGMAHWMIDTNSKQISEGVHFYTFDEYNTTGEKHQPSLEGLIRQIGINRFGKQFDTWETETQEKKVLDYIRKNHTLLILDNLERILGWGEQPRLLDKKEAKKLQIFLNKAMQNGSTKIIITSRRDEEWLGLNLEKIELDGLDRKAAEELAIKVLRKAGIKDIDTKLQDKEWKNEFYLLLMRLGYHPLALQVILPHLKMKSPETIIREFEQGNENLDRNIEYKITERERNLFGCLGYSLNTLSEDTKKLLPLIGFFRNYIDLNFPNWIKKGIGTEEKNITLPDWLLNSTPEQWKKAIEELIYTGLAKQESSDIFSLHPLLPWYLAKLSSNYTELEQAFVSFGAIYSSFLNTLFERSGEYNWEIKDAPAYAVHLFSLHKNTLFSALRYARKLRWAEEIRNIFRGLYEFMELAGESTSAYNLLKELIKEWEIETALIPNTPEADLYADLHLKQANYFFDKRQFDKAEEIYKDLENKFEEEKSKLAILYHQLGMIAQEQRDFNKAEEYYQKSLEIKLRLHNIHGAAQTYHQLGNIATNQRDFKKAEKYYQESLKVSEKLNNLHGAATTYHQLGMVAEEQRDFKKAEEYYQKSLKIFSPKQLNDLHSEAKVYHQLGYIAQEQRDFKKAEEYYQKSLKIKLQLNDIHGEAQIYHQLGIIAQEQRDFKKAEEYSQKGLELFLQLNDLHSAASVYHQLGIVAYYQRDFKKAEEYYQKSLEIKLQLNDIYGMAQTYGQLGILYAERKDGETSALYFIKALLGYLGTNAPYYAKQVLDNMQILYHWGLFDKALVERIWQEEAGGELPREFEKAIFEEQAETQEAGGDKFLESLMQLVKSGRTNEEIIIFIEEMAGQKMPPEMRAQAEIMINGLRG